MEKIGDAQTKSEEFEEEQREIANIRSLFNGGYTYQEPQSIINRVPEQKTMTNAIDDTIYCLRGSGGSSLRYMNIARRISKADRKHESKYRNDINMR